jgi:hypothetical protein
MADKKIYKRLPAVLQTTAIKNFFESTVEQLFSKSNVDNIQGFIGSQRSEDAGASGTYLPEPSITKRFYGLSPTVNTLNPDTGDSENLIYYDELVDILKTYGVDVRDHNKIFSENYSTFLPPIDIDKFVNYSEYYWAPKGPSTIVVQGTLEHPVDVDRDVLGQTQFTPPGGVPFRNGMIVEFGGDFVIPNTRLGVEYIVEGVGESIFFVPKADNFSTRFSTPGEDQFDLGLEDTDDTVETVHSSADYLSNVEILSGGVGYVEPKLFVYDNPLVSVTDNSGDNISALTPYWQDDPANVDLRTTDPSTGLQNANLISLASIVDYETQQGILTEYDTVKALYDNSELRTGSVAEFDLGVDSDHSITDVDITNNNSSDPKHLYSGQVRYVLYDKLVEHQANLSLTAEQATGNSTPQVFETSEFVLDSVTDIKVGQQITGLFKGIVKSITPASRIIELEEPVPVTVGMFSQDSTLRFQGRGFSADLRFDDVHTVTEGSVVTILESQRKPGVNPNNFNDYYVINALPGFDQDGGPPWSGTDTQEVSDYLLQQRGATNRNVWSRVNFWYHRQNFVDAGDELPPVSQRAKRPIIEFDRNLELYNHGTNSLGFVNTASTELTLDDINGRPSGFLIDGVPTENASFIFPEGKVEDIKYVYTTTTVQDDVEITFSDPANPDPSNIEIAVVGNVTLGGFAENGYVDSIEIIDPGANYTSNVEVVISHSAGRDAQATAVVDGSGSITEILLFDRTPESVSYDGEYVNVRFNGSHGLSDGDTVNVIGADPSEYNGTYQIIVTSSNEFLYLPKIRPSADTASTLPTVKTGGRSYYETGLVRVTRLPDPNLNPEDAVDGDENFVPLEAQPGDIVQVTGGSVALGREYVFESTEWSVAQEKVTVNQAPLFNLYDTSGRYLGDNGVYPNNNFAGSKIFGYATTAPDSDSVLGTQPDTELGFPVVFKQFKATSEIVFENYLDTSSYSYRPLGADSDLDVTGYYYYKLLTEPVGYHSAWKVVDDRSTQRIYTVYNITQIEVDQQRVNYFVGCLPELDSSAPSGYDIRVRVNGEIRTDYTYGTTQSGYIDFESFDLSAGDLLEIDAYGEEGLFDINTASKYELPLGWSRNPENQDILYTSEPEFLEHFRRYLSDQPGFRGDVFANNNSSSIPLNPRHATEIVNTTQDIMLGAFLIDDQPHNLVDALRFTALEYSKYKNRVQAEIDRYNQLNNIDSLGVDAVLEQVLRNVISFKVGNEVFNRTYVMPFGDNYEEETFTVALNQTDFVLSTSLDFNQLENTLLVFHNGNLLRIDNCYVLSDHAPITITVQNEVGLQPGDTITARIYNSERDSAQCPPTPSTMGLFPLYIPTILVDDSYQTPVEVILGHDGSRTPIKGDSRDHILLEYEKRIYNAAKKEFREANSLPEYNLANVRAGAFRDTGYAYTEFYDLMRNSFSRWTVDNTVDAVTNEYFDLDNEFTWNYGTQALPGHWRGIYEYYYDTVRPHTHPWEMLGFTEEPLWWDTEYTRQEINQRDEVISILSYGPDNTRLWQDLEQGIIRQGPRENFSDGRYLLDNPYRRVGLSEIIPVDNNGELISPFRLFSTGTTQILEQWQNSVTGNNDPDYAFRTSSFQQVNSLNVSYDTSGGISGNGNVYVSTTENSVSIPRKDLNVLVRDESPMPDDKIVAVLVNGEPVYGIKSPDSWNNQDVWHYNLGYDYTLQDQLRVITPQVLGISNWDSESHSPVVGWASDGLPIYGPYGYEDPSDSNSSIVAIRSPWVLREANNRQINPGGAHTGVFIEDYKYDATLSGQPGYTGKHNQRYGVTPDSPTQPIYYYVLTVDENLEPAFPYHVGGGTTNVDQWANNYFSTAPLRGRISDVLVQEQGALYDPANTTIAITDSNGNDTATANAVIEDGHIVDVIVTDAGSGYSEAQATVVDSSGSGVRAKLDVVVSTSDNSTGNSFVNTDATASIVSVLDTQLVRDGNEISNNWKFGDVAPAEYAWRSTEQYPFAVAEALLLAKPGRFARIFSEPSKLHRPDIDRRMLLNRDTNKRWQFLDPAQFSVHGDIDNNGNFVTNVGYTQFINSWLKFQGLDTDVDFVPKLRTLNMKLSHRMSGYIDKDTLTVRTDQYSNDGNATSLIVPQKNISVAVHSSPNKTRNFYSGVQIEKTLGGYRLRGYDRNQGYFSILESDQTGPRQRVTVGGEPASYVPWEPNQTYRKDAIVERLGNFYQAKLTVSSGTEFDKSLWTRLPSLPQIGGATSTLYQRTTGRTLRVNYETEFDSIDQVYDFLISLGRYQQRSGYDFGDYDEAIADVRDWSYAAKQFLFWTTGQWEVGNTLELSPLAPRVAFSVPTGFISKINRSDREQFSVVNAAGAVIDPQQCEIVRQDNRIEIAPPAGDQIYGVLLYTKEIEHAMTLDNLTEFADVIYNPVINQKHSRLKVTGTRTRNWTGKLLSEGFVIDEDELKPNLDNLAESLGRYHELGFIPVEKQVYEQARALFGYTDREYLRELDIIDDQQFDFYKGMIQSKGTDSSLTRIGRSKTVAEGNISVYSEWALRVADFGDTESDQSLELQVNKSDIVQNPQLITLALPEDITNSVERIDVLEAKFVYTSTPEIELPAPADPTGTQALAAATLDSTGKLSSITVTEAGSGYGASIGADVIAANVLVDSESTRFVEVAATPLANNIIDFDQPEIVFSVTDNISGANIDAVVPANGNVVIEDVLSEINSNALVNSHLTMRAFSNLNNGNVVYNVRLSGSDFTVTDGANIGVANGSYQPVQKYAIDTATNSEPEIDINDVTVLVDGQVVPSAQGNVTNWTFSASNTITVTSDSVYPENANANSSASFALGTTVTNIETDSNGRYRYLELYINGVRVTNIRNGLGVDANTGLPLYSGTVYEIVGGNTLRFPDINLIPKQALAELYDPPLEQAIEYNEQRELYYGFNSDTEFRLVEKATVEFDNSYQGDLPGKTLNIRVTSKDRIAVRTQTVRSFEITPDAQDDDVLFIDIDNADKFLKRPSDVADKGLWPTMSAVDASGVTDSRYPTIRNSGYVNASNVNFQAYDIGSLPDLFSDDVIIKPDSGDLIHIAVSENRDWNVYRMSQVNTNESFLFRNEDGDVSLYTDVSLFNFLDGNQIGEDNTGRFLDYVLTLKNANISDTVVVWRNEDIVQAQQYDLREFEAPRMVEARIASIGPADLTEITDLQPATSRTLQNLTLTPLDNTSNTVLVTSPDLGDLREGDAVQLIDNVGISYVSEAKHTVDTGNNTITMSAQTVESISVDSNGDGYDFVPNVTVDTGTAEGNTQAVAVVAGSIDSVDISGTSDHSEADAYLTGPGNNADIQVDIVDGSVTAINIIDPGSEYNTSALPSVSIESPANGVTANAEVTSDDIDDTTGSLLRIRVTDPGSGYTASQRPNVTIDPSPTGNDATASAVITGNIAVDVIDGGNGYVVGDSNIEVVGNGTYADASLNITGSVNQVLVQNTAVGYTGVPDVTIEAPLSGNTATATAVMNTGVDRIQEAANISSDGNVYVSLTGNVSFVTAGNSNADLTQRDLDNVRQARLILANSYLVENLDANTGTFELADTVFSDTQPLGEFVLSANATTSDNSIVIQGTPGLVDGDVVFYNSNVLGNISGVTVTNTTTTINMDSNLTANVSAGEQVSIVGDSVWQEGVIDVTGYTVKIRRQFEPLASNATYHTVNNLTLNSFTIESANVTDSVNAIGVHLNQSEITVNNHNQQVGDFVRLDTNTVSGRYQIQRIQGNTMVIDAPFRSGFTEGNIIGRGVEIKTTNPHTITSVYAANNKRVAVHFAEPLYYNKVYPISRVTPDSLIVDGFWPQDDTEHVFYEERYGTVNSAEPLFVPGDANSAVSANALSATNVIELSRNSRLNDMVAHYSSNSAVISSKHVTVFDLFTDSAGTPLSAVQLVDEQSAGNTVNYVNTVAVVDPEALPDNNVSVEVMVTRQILRSDNRYPVLTTLDHNRMFVNGSAIEIDSYNNPEALTASINRNIGLRRAMTKERATGFGMNFLMLNDPNTPVLENRSASEIDGYGPYLRDENLISRLSGGATNTTEELELTVPGESNEDSVFNKGSILIGPHRGLFYYEPSTGIQYMWNSRSGEYRPVNLSAEQTQQLDIAYRDTASLKAPEFHIDAKETTRSITEWRATTQTEKERRDAVLNDNGNPVTAIVYGKDTVVSRGGRYYVATSDINYQDNVTFNTSLWREVSDSVELSALTSNSTLTLTSVPGTGLRTTGNPVPGTRLPGYLMTTTKQFQVGAETHTLWRYRLRPNPENSFLIYEAVQHADSSEPYYILIDKSAPLTVSHDFYGTINAHSDMGVYTDVKDTDTAQGRDYDFTDYYYDNHVDIELNGNNKLTNASDPVQRRRSESYVIDLPAVEPAMPLNSQIIPEPFAVQGGNGTDARENFLSLPRLTVSSTQEGNPIVDNDDTKPLGEAEITVQEPGYNRFLLWTPGLTPGKWSPAYQGPGPLPGAGNNNVGIGYGRGYHTAGDNHLSGEYPVIPYNGYDKPLPRLLYTRKYSVSPAVNNYVTSVYTDSNGRELTEQEVLDLLAEGKTVNYSEITPDLSDQGNTDINSTKVRPEEIFVACFWTEPHRYKNQLVGWNYKDPNAAGLPKPIYSDYDGTVTRVKYIRLTELPPTAVTQRPIPDTGWAGNDWNNKRTDLVFAENSNREDEIWDRYRPSEKQAGSTGDTDESNPTLTVDTSITPRFS